MALLVALAISWAATPGQAKVKLGLDFIPQRVWVGPECRVKVRLVRKGPGRLSPRVGNITLLRIQVGKVRHDFSFRAVDPRGVLRRGPGVITFTSGVRVNGRLPVQVVVDPRGRIKETGEGKANRLALLKFPDQCRPRPLLSFLAVTRAYARQGRLRLVIKRSPKVTLSPVQLKKVRLRLRSAGQKGLWTMERVLARSARGGGGVYHFNTRLKAKPGAAVRVTLVSAGRQKRAVFTLPGRRVVRRPRPRTLRSRIRLSKQLRTILARRVVPGGGAAKMLNHGIQVTLDSGGDRSFARGEIFQIMVAMPGGHPAGRVSLDVYKGRHRVTGFSLYSGFDYSGSDYSIRIPVRVLSWADSGGHYYILARLNDQVWGLSDMFTIEGPAAWGRSPDFELQLAAPNRGDSWAQNATHMISWRVLGDYRGDPHFEVTLLDGDRQVLIIDSATAVYHANSRTYTLNWRIPESVAPGTNYRIRVRDYNSIAQDTSDQPFTINRAHDLILHWPPTSSDRPINIRMGETYIIRWSPVGNVADRPIYINLNGPGYVKRLADIPRGSRRQFVWRFGFECEGRDWVPPGGDYFIRLMTDRGDPFRVATSARFQVIAPRITYLNPGTRWTWRRRDRRAIRWSVRNMPEGKRVRIVLMKGDVSYLDINPSILASAGGYVWTVGLSSGTDFTSNMGGPGLPPPGCDYRIRITMENCGQVVAYSNYFCLE